MMEFSNSSTVMFEGISSDVILDKPEHMLKLKSRIVSVELSPYDWSQNVILVAFTDSVAIGCMRFQEENEDMKSKYSLEMLQEFPLTGRVHALDLSPKTHITSVQKEIQFACTLSNHNVYVFENSTSNATETKVLSGHTNYVNAVAFDRQMSSCLLASVSDDFTCRVWSSKEVKCNITFFLTSPGVSVKWHAVEPNKLLVGEKRGIIRVYNMELEQPIFSLESDIMPLMDVDWAPINHCKIAGLAAGYLVGWDTSKSNYPLSKQQIHADGGKYLRYSNQSDHIVATIGIPHKLIVTNLKNNKYPATVAQLKLASNVTWHYRLPYVCVGVDNNLCFWKVSTK